MRIITFTKKEYSELLEIKGRLDKILKEKKITTPKRDGLVRAFGILKGKIKGNSLDYLSKIRKEWRN